MRISRNVGRTWCWLVAVLVLIAVVPPGHAQPAPAVDAALAKAIRYLQSEAAAARAETLALHITPTGHWQFANAKGEVVTAAGTEETRRALVTLSAGGGNTDKPAALLLTEAAAGRAAANPGQLPQLASLSLLTEGDVYRLQRAAGGAKGERLLAEVRPHLLLEITEPDDVRETLWLLSRKLEAGAVRLLSLESGGPRTLPVTPKRENKGGSPLPDAIDPYGLAKALPALRGQKVLLVGRLDKELIWFQPRTGPEQSILLKDVRDAAAAGDVSLVLLDSRLNRQPGERTWAYLKVSVPGLAQAIQGATIGDFYNALAGAQGKLVLRAYDLTADRTRIEGVPLSPAWGVPAPSTGGGKAKTLPEERSVGGILQEMVSGLTGNVVTTSVQMDLRSRARQIEIERRWLPWLPSSLQMGYALLLVIGLAGWPMAVRWWARVWPSEEPQEYGQAAGYWAARTVRASVFVVLFVPLVAMAAFPLQVLKGLAETVQLILRGVRKRRAGAGAGDA